MWESAGRRGASREAGGHVRVSIVGMLVPRCRFRVGLGVCGLLALVSVAGCGQTADPAPTGSAQGTANELSESTEAKAIVAEVRERFRRDAPGVIVVDQRVFNRLGYNLIAEKRFAEAIGVLRLVSYVYPKSWNAADSLGDAYITAGQKEEGRAAYQRAINLAAADPDIDPDRRKSIIKDEQTKLEKLKP